MFTGIMHSSYCSHCPAVSELRKGFTMARTIQLASMMLGVGILLCGCLPTGTPAYVNDGQTIVVMAQDSTGNPAFWTYDVKKKTATSHPAPKEWQSNPAKAFGNPQGRKFISDGEWELESVRMIGDPVWVTWRVPVRDGKDSSYESLSSRFDPQRNEFVSVSLDPNLMDWAEQAVPASHEGKRCLYLKLERDTYEVRSFPELERLGKSSDAPIAASDFWCLWSLQKGLVVLDHAARKVCVISTEEEGKAKRNDEARLRYALISEDRKALLMVFLSGKQNLSFGVFDTSNGKYLWGEKNYRWTSTGVPVVKREELWVIESNWTEEEWLATKSTSAPATKPASSSRRSREEGMALVRYRPDKMNGSAIREVVATYPISLDHEGGQFAPAPDGSHFVVVVNGNPSRLVFIPIRTGITDKDIRVAELVDRK